MSELAPRLRRLIHSVAQSVVVLIQAPEDLEGEFDELLAALRRVIQSRIDRDRSGESESTEPESTGKESDQCRFALPPDAQVKSCRAL